MDKDYSASLLDARRAMKAAESALTKDDYESAKDEMYNVIFAAREVIAWVNHQTEGDTP